MSTSRPRSSRVLGGLLIAGLALLALFLLRSGQENVSEGVSTLTPDPAPSATLQSAEGALVPLPTVDPTLAAIDRPSLPEEWATAVIDRAIVNLNGVSQSAHAEFDSLQDKGLWGPLSVVDGGFHVGGQIIEAENRTAIEVAMFDPSEAEGLTSVGRVEREDDVLTLRLTDAGDGNLFVRRIAGSLLPADVLVALVEEAQARDLTLTGGYWQTPGDGATLALVEAQSVSRATEAAMVVVSVTPTLPTTILPSASPTSLPTPGYEPDIRQMVESGLLPLIEPADSAPDGGGIENLEDEYAWAGTLTWESGEPYVDDKPLDLDATVILTLALFGLEEEDTVVLLDAQWDGDGTLITNQSASQYFYAFRMPELVYWMTLVAEENGGQWVVAYDNVVDYRAITVLDFQPLASLPEATSTPDPVDQ